MWFSWSRSKIDAAGYDRNENECFSSHNVLGVDDKWRIKVLETARRLLSTRETAKFVM